MSTTLTELRNRAAFIATYHHDNLPAGTFAATVRLDIDSPDMLREYLLAGDLDDPQAKIVGRIDSRMNSAHYSVFATDRPLGGVGLSLTATTLDEALAVLAAHLAS